MDSRRRSEDSYPELILSLCHKRPHAFSPPPLIPPPRLIS